MTIIKEIKFTKTVTETLPTENETGLRYAVVWKNRKVIAVFDDMFWAENFIGGENEGMSFTIREIAE